MLLVATIGNMLVDELVIVDHGWSTAMSCHVLVNHKDRILRAVDPIPTVWRSRLEASRRGSGDHFGQRCSRRYLRLIQTVQLVHMAMGQGTLHPSIDTASHSMGMMPFEHGLAHLTEAGGITEQVWQVGRSLLRQIPKIQVVAFEAWGFHDLLLFIVSIA